MTNLTGLNVEFTGDASDVEAAAKRAKAAVKGVGDQTQKTGKQQVDGRKKALAFGDGIGRLGTISKSARGQIRNVGFQVQDIAVQIGMGTTVMRTMSLQLPQLLGGFGAMGALLGAVAAVTLPLLSAAMTAFGSKAIDATKAAENLTTAVSAWKTAADDANMSNEALAKSFGGISEGLRATLQAGEELAWAKNLNELDVAITSLRVNVSDLEYALGGLTQAQTEGRSETEFGKFLVQEYSNAVNSLANELGLTENQVKKLTPQLLALSNSSGPEEAAVAANDLFTAAQDINVEFNGLTESGLKFFNVVQDVAVAANKMAPPIMDANTATGLLVDGFRIARAEMWQLQGEAPAAFAAVSDAISAAAARVRGMFSLGGGGGEPATPQATPSRGGGGASPDKEAQRNLDRLVAKLATEAETMAAGYANQQDVLQTALDAKLISQDRFEELSLKSQQDYVSSMNTIDAARRQSAISTAGDLFGQLAGLMSSENKRLFNIGKAAAIGEAVINTYKGISKSLSQYPMPIAGVFAAAHAAIGFANVAKIKSTQFGGGGGGGGVSPVATPAAGAANSTLVNVTLNGDNFSRGGVRDLLDNINDVIGEGGRIRLA